MVLAGLDAGGQPISDNLLQILFEDAPDAYYLSDTKGRFYSGNRAAEALTGYRREELIGKNFTQLDLLPRDQLGKALRLLALSAMQKPTGPDEFTLRRKDGSLVFVEIRTHPVKIKGKTVVLGIARDITERKKSQELTERKKSQELLEENIRKLINSREAVIQAIASIVEMRDPYTAGHQSRVSDLARAIAVEMKFSPDQVDTIRVAGLIHDLGKIAVPAEILSKPGGLDEAELQLVREHPTTGYNILKSIDMMEKVAQIVYQHHERMDGSGYPLGLAGREILPETRILSVAEAVEAMLSHRPYRQALTLKKTLEEITRQKGILFDTPAVEACVTLFNKKEFKLGS
ncbi:MAG: PAS domain S-box protein [Acidobacteria bacterium]|nr:PAS domain S-box protein [Acidobacteriota bacterium]MBE3131237.1 PAS domain S-box protein [Acidobacteriota bacterium]